MLSKIKNRKIIVIVISLITTGLILCAGSILWSKLLVPTSSPNYSGGQIRSQSSSSDNSQGGVTDLNSNTQSSNTAQPPQTNNGPAIALTTPTANSTLQSNNTISGTSSLGRVEYRLVDNEVGVISQGELSVISGKFSGIIHFTPHSNKGELVVFSYDPNNGAEVNSIRIAVNFIVK